VRHKSRSESGGTALASRPKRAAPVRRTPWRISVRDLELPALIGVHRHERDGRQRVRINLTLDVAASGAPLDDKLANALNYEIVVNEVRRVVGTGHVNLVETLAERIAEICLADRRVVCARVRVEKLDVFADAAAVGVEIERFNVVD
jgi:7,8-dihydroneopterin aldolase/epimerase/oxygenase